MKVSLNYLKKYLDFKLPDISQIADRVDTQLGALEEAPIYLGDKFRDIHIVKVISTVPIQGSDHLNACKIDDAGQISRVDRFRDEAGYIDVVCGASNVQLGCLAVYIPPGVVLPSSQLKISSKKIMGQNSHGMLLSASELGIGSDHDGIIIIDQPIKEGTRIADYLELNDYILDIENKMFTHRPDCFGLIGLAREISGIFDHPFKSPDWYLAPKLNPRIKKENKYKLNLNIEDPRLTDRFSALIIQNVKIKPSSLKIQSYLNRMGIRPINNIVDITNLVMLETAQPLHAYDLNKLNLKGNELTLTAKNARNGQKIRLINNKEINLNENDLIIANDHKPLALAGIMGGLESEIEDHTTSIVIESANFDMFSIRKSSMTHGLFSDSVTRFNKGQSPFQTVMALKRALNLIYEDDPQIILSSDIVDNNRIAKEFLKKGTLSNVISLDYNFINELLGSDLRAKEIKRILTNVQFEVSVHKDIFRITPPYWRTDILIKEDIVEEVGRILGYHQIKMEPLVKQIKPASKNKFLEFKDKIREILKTSGSNEVLTHSFVSRKMIESSAQSVESAYQIANSISPELQYYRLSLSPSLVSSIYRNIRSGNSNFGLFELGVAHNLDLETNFPVESRVLCFSYSSKNELDGAPFFRAKHFLNYLISELGLEGFRFEQLSEHINEVDQELSQIVKPFNEMRSALIFAKNNSPVGVIGEYNLKLLSAYKTPKYSAGFELLLDRVYQTKTKNSYRELSKFPSIKKDITISVSSSTKYATLKEDLDQIFESIIDDDIELKICPKSIFKKSKQSQTKNISFSLEFNSKLRTLREDLIKEYFEKFTTLSGYDLI